MKNLTYDKLEMQKYLRDRNIYPKTAKLIFDLRTSTSFVKMNFKSRYGNNPLCPAENCDKQDTQEHLIEHVETQAKVIYTNLFSTSPEEILQVANVLKQGLDQSPVK